MSHDISITAFYKFAPQEESTLEEIQATIRDAGEEHNIHGLVIVGTEGINGTVSGPRDGIASFKKFLEDLFGAITFKDSNAEQKPFKRWFVKIRDEIVTLGDATVLPDGKHNHISPKEWNRMMEEDDVVVLDARNDYETALGTFEGAVDPNIRTFQEFPAFVETSGIPKDKKIMMYCTGGIRCEKALLEMEKQGFKHVYQLDGGILRYFEECPNEKFQGECFVFDHRVAVTQDLKPSERYSLCPHCGDPGDMDTTCVLCKKDAVICKDCKATGKDQYCSKDCRYRVEVQKVAV